MPEPARILSDFLEDVLPKHARLTRVVQTLLENILNDEGIDFLSISGRTKSHEAALEKINRKSYDDPVGQITDLTGIRVVTFLDNQVRQISKVISEAFDIDDENSMDRGQILGSDKVGYRSIHFVCNLGARREGIKEYRGLSHLKFEIQVRTVLQHAWAELTHDRSYKFSGVLPANLQRKLNLYAGMLEIVDVAFDEIALSLDSYKETLRSEDDTELLEEELNSISLTEFLTKLAREKHIKINGIIAAPDLIEELDRFGIKTIKDLQSLISDEVIDFFRDHEGANDYGLLRTAMMHRDLERYLNVQPHWASLTRPYTLLLSQKYGDPALSRILEMYGKTVID